MGILDWPPLERARLSMEGLSLGDALGERFFGISPEQVERAIHERAAPPSPWFYSDDTVMACAIFALLREDGRIDPDRLAQRFADDYRREPNRGYGGTTRGILRVIGEGASWADAARSVFDGEGSCGNGAAMRVGPLGAYFAGDLPALKTAARASAVVTHAHPDGQTGALAVALAASWMVESHRPGEPVGTKLIEHVLEYLPQTETFYRLRKTLQIPLDCRPSTAAAIVGNGASMVAADTVPFCLWCASRHAEDYAGALWSAVSVWGDVDTNAAIVGGLVALSAGPASLPPDWLAAREPLGL